MRYRALLGRFLVLATLVLAASVCARAYSVLTHEQIVDLVWQEQIVPLLKTRFPGVTEDDLRRAHAYAYGGAVIQDLGYYPFGSHLFSDLAHYVRSGDFVVHMINDSENVDDYAFALGALSHYCADIVGHPDAVNRAVAIEYPKLRARYGNVITYAQDTDAHLKTEFGFDVVQIAKHRYAPQAYHDFIGFEVSKPLLERAFYETYGLKLDEVIPHLDLAISTYRYAVSSLIPKVTKVALATRHDQIVREYQNFSRQKFLFTLSRADFEKRWGRDYYRPSCGAKVLAFLLKLVPKFGPFSKLQYKDPTPATEDLYFKSLNKTIGWYEQLLRGERTRDVKLADRDFDTGGPSRAGEYSLADHAYAKLVDSLAKDKFANVSPALRQNILAFYGDAMKPPVTKSHHRDWARLQKQLQQLRETQAVAEKQ